jgi:heptosyltransferase-3
VVHMYARYAYKLWHVTGWKTLIAFLHERGYAVVLTGGPGQDEVSYARDVAQDAGSEVTNLVGKLSLGATAEVIRRARLYVGPDTSVSHVAAATGTPTKLSDTSNSTDYASVLDRAR